MNQLTLVPISAKMSIQQNIISSTTKNAVKSFSMGSCASRHRQQKTFLE